MKSPRTQKELLTTKPKKGWKQKQKRKKARDRDRSKEGLSLHGSKFFTSFRSSWKAPIKKIRSYIIYDEKSDRYITNIEVYAKHMTEYLQGNVYGYTVGPKSRAMKFHIPDNSSNRLSINYIIGDIKHTGAWRTRRVK